MTASASLRRQNPLKETKSAILGLSEACICKRKSECGLNVVRRIGSDSQEAEVYQVRVDTGKEKVDAVMKIMPEFASRTMRNTKQEIAKAV
jgi:hypothetical protein